MQRQLSTSHTQGCVGGILRYVHINVGSDHFWGVKISIFRGFSEKTYNCWCMKKLWIFLWGHNKIGIFLGLISIHSSDFFIVKVQNGDIFGGSHIFKYFGVCQIFRILFGVSSRWWAQAYV